MTAKEMKQKTFALIEEYYPDAPLLAEDEDVLNKINGVINSVQMDLMKYRKVNSSYTYEIGANDDKVIDLTLMLNDCYQIRKIVMDGTDEEYDMPNEDTLVLSDDFEGNVTIYYYKYPTQMDLFFDTEEEAKKYDEEFEFDVDTMCQEIMPYGIAADLLKMDMISNYGTYFANRYAEMKQTLDMRKTGGIISITGGADI